MLEYNLLYSSHARQALGAASSNGTSPLHPPLSMLLVYLPKYILLSLVLFFYLNDCNYIHIVVVAESHTKDHLPAPLLDFYTLRNTKTSRIFSHKKRASCKYFKSFNYCLFCQPSRAEERMSPHQLSIFFDSKHAQYFFLFSFSPCFVRLLGAY